ncbi:hypothetical protein TVAG_129970 [Trichomonas vaginalis G3]|uniref:Uncharacterized protein n=1 Tax=Trichomonas vaginalis (strain ATCC PRA-98 / G3) TaxID=412133 RepID=A2DI93_TRIV3|nr:GTPase activation domain, GAP family [Trichomonas vaginalis G3]EAY19889.1 hypothetical protein TVAG_129970 [Trichomonas vaginalis G3]KAI5509984.1 GTPase activation domain, GAP family [Trichomonas vaginalis G3]|eukprot:XP_001580875.1 hypothetical protein [Trichomonas vaginalis G3]
MTVVRKDIGFTIPPMKGEETPYVKPTYEQVNFRFRFQRPPRKVQFSPDIDEYWNQFIKDSPKLSFTDLYERVKSCTNPSSIMAAFSDSNVSDNQLTSDLMRLIQCYPDILPPNKLNVSLSPIKLTAAQFTLEFPPRIANVFNSIISLTQVILDRLPTYEQKMEVISKTALGLLPKTFKEQLKTRPFLTILCIFPVIDEAGKKNWIIIKRDRTVNLVDMDTNKVVKTFSLEGIIEDINFKENTISFEGFGVYKFTNQNSICIWKDAQNDNSDVLVTLLSCIPVMMEFKDKIPSIFYDQMKNLISNDVYDFVRAFGTVAVSKPGKKAFINLVQYVLYSGTVTTLVRYLFGTQIKNTIAENTIFREASACSVLFSMISDNYGYDFIDKTVNKAANCQSKIETVEIITRDYGNLPLQMKNLISATFRATRRKYPDRLVPLLAISSMFMLRFISPVMANMGKTKLAGDAMKAFVFFNSKDKSEEEFPKEIFTRIAEQYISNLGYSDSTYHFAEANLEEIVADCATYNKEICDNLKRKPTEHPLYWSMLELLENCFIGDEDLMTVLSQGYLIEN